jgi:MtN3 and saliva related transmembrane protein
MTAIGLVAGILTTGCWLPQLLRSWRTRSTSDISWPYLIALALGVGLWAVYGAATADLPVFITNTATVAALVALAGMKAVFDRRTLRNEELG